MLMSEGIGVEGLESWGMIEDESTVVAAGCGKYVPLQGVGWAT